MGGIDVERLDGAAVRAWGLAATTALGLVRDPIDSLNVFPVADADTGTNLHLTLAQGAEEAAALGPDVRPADALQALARGALLGARGNSGVIVSQFLLGLARAASADADAVPPGARAGDPGIDAAGLARALDAAQRTARSSVARPVEGTILTASTAAAAAAHVAAAAGSSLGATALAALDGARAALARTPDQLAVLRAAQVVDAGAAGLVVILEALVAVITGRPAPGSVPLVARSVAASSAPALASVDTSPDGEFEVMYIVESVAADFGSDLSRRLQALGESVAVVGGPVVWHAHVHCSDPAAAVAAGLPGAQRQITVRHLALPAPSPHGRLGLVVGTTAPALIRALARSGAVVMVLTGAPASPASVRRAVIDTGAARVAVLPGSPDARAAAFTVAAGLDRAEAPAAGSDDPGVRVRVFDAVEDVRVVAGLAAAVAARNDVVDHVDDVEHVQYDDHLGRELAAIDAALAAVRTADVDASDDAVAHRIADDLLAGGGVVLTMLRGANAGDAATSGLLAHLAASYPDLEIVVLDGGQAAPALALAVE